MKKVLIACEESQAITIEMRKLGLEAFSCDIQECSGGHPEWHLQCDVREILNQDWDLMIAHPDCTYLTNAGVRHLHDHVTSKKGKKTKISGSARWVKMHEAAEFFMELWNANIDKICIENPIPHKYAKNIIGQYTQLIQPWMFGHGETKATCLWLKNLPKLKPTKIVEGREPRIHKMSPSKNRAKLRSKTYSGIAKAIAEQWGNL